MEDNCTMRPCATDFSIAAIMSRHGRAKARCKDRDPPDAISPLGKIFLQAQYLHKPNAEMDLL